MNKRIRPATEDLLKYLNSLQPGTLPECVDEIAMRLMYCWESLAGHRQGGMRAHKLRRMENVRWEPPLLIFEIERHGGTALGSTRAEMQQWTVDLESATAEITKYGRRQLYAMDARLDVKPIAKELADAIISRRADERLKWRGDVVEVLTSVVIPHTNNRTTSGRRKRLAARLEELLLPQGWHRKTIFRLQFEKRETPVPSRSAESAR